MEWIERNENNSSMNVCYKGHRGFTSLAASYFSGSIFLDLFQRNLGMLLFGCGMTLMRKMETICGLLSSLTLFLIKEIASM